MYLLQTPRRMEEKPRRKWTLGSFFRRRGVKVESSDEKRGMTSLWSGSATSSEGFGGSLTRRDRRKARHEATRPPNSSSDDDESIVSLTRFKSDESLTNRKSRSARTERYLKRMSRDEETVSACTPSPRLTPQLVRRQPPLTASNTNGLPAVPPPPPPRDPQRLLMQQQQQSRFQYLADKTPRSRRPIHVVSHDDEPSPPSWLNPTPAHFEPVAVIRRPHSKTPPPPPIRRYSRQSSVSSLDEPPKRNNNLEDALNELEAIYKSLRLDEDVPPQNISAVLRPPNRRSGVPDLVTDDMAYRRLTAPAHHLHQPPQQHNTGSYLLVSPAATFDPAPSLYDDEPDITLDDMSYRALMRASSKDPAPHPPFGIPLIPASPAPPSDYLHATPVDKFRPSLRPRRTPDVVKDDLAFRTLRKDTDKKKRAVRSLSANLMSLMEQDNNNISAQSLSNLRGPPPSWLERANLSSTETLTAQSRPTSFFSSTVSRPTEDGNNLDELLSALAKEAHETSHRLGLELERLRRNTSVCGQNNNRRGSSGDVQCRIIPCSSTGHSFDVIKPAARDLEMTSTLRTSDQRARVRADDQQLRADRIAKYKEERKKQLAAQYTATSSSSGVESGTDCRRRGGEPLVIRTTRASRLRAAAAAAPQEVKRRSKVNDSCETASSREQGTMRRSEERDKSSKRKSNLNRSLTEELVPPSSDSTTTAGEDECPRRRSKVTPPPPPVFQRLQCNVAPARPLKKVDSLMAKTKEFEARMDRLAAKKTVNLASRQPDGKNLVEILSAGERPKIISDKNTKNDVKTESVTTQPKSSETALKLAKKLFTTQPPEEILSKSVVERAFKPKANNSATTQPTEILAESMFVETTTPKTAEKNKVSVTTEQTVAESVVEMILKLKELDNKSVTTQTTPTEILSESVVETAPKPKANNSATTQPTEILAESMLVETTTPKTAERPESEPNKDANKSAISQPTGTLAESIIVETTIPKTTESELNEVVSVTTQPPTQTVAESVVETVLKLKELDNKSVTTLPLSISSETALKPNKDANRSAISQPTERLAEFVVAETTTPKTTESELNEVVSVTTQPPTQTVAESVVETATSSVPIEPLIEPVVETSTEPLAETTTSRRNSSILKKASPILRQGAKSILKKRSSADDLQQPSDPDTRPILKKRGAEDGEPVRPILKSAGGGLVKNQVALTIGDEEGEEEEERRPSVSERAQLFMRLTDQQQRPHRDPLVRRAKRFSTQPVTSEEVDEAIRLQQVSEDEPSQLSLAERVRIFDRKIEEAAPVAQKRTLRRRVTSTRFRTLPVTEVEQAVSPLMASFAKPPDPCLLGGMSARAAREAILEHASKVLRGPETDAAGDARPRGILKHPEEEEEEEEEIVRGILKIPASAVHQARLLQDSAVKSALKKESSFDEPSPRAGILKESSVEVPPSESSDEDKLHRDSCDTSSSGGREVNTIIGEQRLVTNKNESSSSSDSSESERPQRRSKTSSDVPSAISIAQRLAALKHSGETEWRKRVANEPPLKPLQTSASLPGSPGGILAEKLGQLDKASHNWKNRVGPNQALEFTVAGRMGVAAGTPPPTSSPQDRKKKTPKPARFKSKTAGSKSESTPNSPAKKQDSIGGLCRSVSAPEGGVGGGKVEVPSPHDATFAAFFSTTATTQTTHLPLLDFEQLEQHTLLIEHKRTVKTSSRRLASRNPVKALAQRTDLMREYQEVRTGAADRELKRINLEKLAKHSNLAVEALAGLASKEDFTAVALKKATDPPPSALLLPYRDLMLLRVKGRRHVQTRLVEPLASSVNSGDSYILVTPNAVYNWLGGLSNVIERTRSAELALQISQQKDLGCAKAGGSVLTVDENKSLHKRAFWRLLGVEDGDGQPACAGHPDEDEIFEASVTDTNMVYTVEGDELVPLEKFWGALPRIEMLDHSKVLVFDFGCEVYVWSGKNARNEARKAGVSLAKELWEEAERPSWGLLAKVSQHMETALFREKFADWPEFHRLIRVKENRSVEGTVEVLPVPILPAPWTEPDLELEGSHLGRGHRYFDTETQRQFCVTSNALTVWHVEEFGCDQIEGAAHFHADGSFVVRWNYSITVTGRELSGAPSKHAMVGRERCAYFFWQGSKASLSQQGAAALLTVELDKEQGPHVRVEQGDEPAAFLRLFQGQMVIHQGHRGQQKGEGECGLYLVRCGSDPQECSLVQVQCSVRQLRSRTSLVLLNRKSGAATVWHGAQSHQVTRKAALDAAHRITPLEFHLETDEVTVVTEVTEGQENERFFAELGGGRRHLYASLPTCTELPPVRMFHLSSASGSFAADEILSPARCEDPPQAFPFQQKELYSASQPALFLLECGPQLWLWQGWWAEEGGEGAVRWQAERRAAMQMALDYWQHHKSGEVRAGLVWAGLEPLAFTNLFPEWCQRDDAAECNIQEGRKAGEELSVSVELARLTRSTYPPAELLLRPLPEGVDPTRLENYLAPHHFEELFGLTKEEFCELPSWKQTNVKKEIGLF